MKSIALPRAWVNRPLLALMKLSRAKFLGGVTPLYLLGAAMAWSEGLPLDIVIFSLGLGVTWAVQLMTHYFNEYWDWETDRLTSALGRRTPFSGGSGVLADDLLPRSVARWAGTGSAILALALGILLVTILHTGPYTLPLISTALLIGYFYSGPPFRLQARGVGEAATAVAVAILVPTSAYYLQTRGISSTLILATLPLAHLLFAMVIGVHFPDYEADRATGKLNLVARLGHRRAARLAAVALVVGYLMNSGEAAFGLVPPTLAMLQLSAPLAILALLAMGRQHPGGAVPFWSVALFASASLATLLGVLLA